MTEQPDLVAMPPGDPAIASAVASLEALAEMPAEQHPAVYEAAHAALRQALDAEQTHGPSTSA